MQRLLDRSPRPTERSLQAVDAVHQLFLPILIQQPLTQNNFVDRHFSRLHRLFFTHNQPELFHIRAARRGAAMHRRGVPSIQQVASRRVIHPKTLNSICRWRRRRGAARRAVVVVVRNVAHIRQRLLQFYGGWAVGRWIVARSAG